MPLGASSDCIAGINLIQVRQGAPWCFIPRIQHSDCIARTNLLIQARRGAPDFIPPGNPTTHAESPAPIALRDDWTPGSIKATM